MLVRREPGRETGRQGVRRPEAVNPCDERLEVQGTSVATEDRRQQERDVAALGLTGRGDRIRVRRSSARKHAEAVFAGGVCICAEPVAAPVWNVQQRLPADADCALQRLGSNVSRREERLPSVAARPAVPREVPLRVRVVVEQEG